jgi:uncharacterized protein YqcC (DUF446 family)
MTRNIHKYPEYKNTRAYSDKIDRFELINIVLVHKTQVKNNKPRKIDHLREWQWLEWVMIEVDPKRDMMTKEVAYRQPFVMDNNPRSK